MTTAALPEITPALALEIINAGLTAGMYPQAKTPPEDDAEKVKDAKELVELATQAIAVANVAGKANMPNWPGQMELLRIAGIDGEAMLASMSGQPAAPPQQQAPPPPPAAPAAPPVETPAPAPQPAAPAPEAPKLAAPLSFPQPGQQFQPTPPAEVTEVIQQFVPPEHPGAAVQEDPDDVVGELEGDPADATAWQAPPGVGVGDGDETVEVPPTTTAAGLAAEAAAQAPDPFAAAGFQRAADLPDPPVELNEPDQQIRPSPGEIWEGPDGQVMKILAGGNGPQMKVILQGMPEGSDTTVPTGFAVRRRAEAPQPGDADYAGPPVPPPVGSGNDPIEQVAPQQRADAFQQAMSPQVSPTTPYVDPAAKAAEASAMADAMHQQRQQAAPAPTGFPAPQPVAQPAAPVTPVTPPAPVPAVAEPVQAPVPTPPVQQQAPPTPPTMPSLPPPPSDGMQDIGRPLHNTEGDERYEEIVEDADRRRTPRGMPIPQDMEGQPPLMPPNLVDVDDETARGFHSMYNALASRARYLHDLEDDYARGCELVYKSHLKEAIRVARQKLGKDATLEEVKNDAEDSDIVTVWRSRRDKHRSEASAFKTLFDIYSNNVSVLSRDWTMRDKEQRGA